MVTRTRVREAIRSLPDPRLILVVAPAGYGKTSAVAQMGTGTSIAWLTVDDGDNDPVQLLTYLAAALERVTRINPDVFAAISTKGTSMRTAIGRLLAALEDSPAPILLVLDDAHLITDRTCLDALSEFIGHLPAPHQVALVARQSPDLPVHGWRARGEVLEIGPAELAMDERESAALIQVHGIPLSTESIGGIVARTEGWPALTLLAAIAAAHRGQHSGVDVSGADLVIADFLRSEVLERQDPERVTFMTQTSILERLSGPLCDAVTCGTDSAATLRDLAQSTVLIDEYGGAYRYHPILREFLQEELQAHDPQLVTGLHQRASAWYESAGDLDPAIRHAFAAGDLDRAGALLGSGFVRYHWTARRTALRAWIRRFGETEIQKRPWLAVLAAFEELSMGERVAAEHFAGVVERGSFEGPPPDGTASFESGRAMLRAVMGRGGAEQMLANASLAVAQEPADGHWRDFALWLLAIAKLTNGDPAGVDELMADAVATARRAGNVGIASCAVGHRAMVAADLGDWTKAAALLSEVDARAVAQLGGYPSAAPLFAVRIRLAMRRGDVAAARQELANLVLLRPTLTAQAAFAVLSLMGFARAYLACGDPAGARAVLAQASDILRRHPGLGVLPAQVAELRRQIAALPIGPGGASTLTAAELRVLALLPYYLSFADIGARLGVRATTIKSHALSIYGKLGASSRPEAVELAIEAGLLEPFLP